MIDYTGKAKPQDYPTQDDALAFGRFVYSSSGGRIRLSEDAARDAIGICEALSRADEEHIETLGEDGAQARRILDVIEAGLGILAHELAVATITERRQREQLHSIAKMVTADIPAVDAVYTIRRHLVEEGG